MWTQIAARITELTGEEFQINNRRSVSGGCINQGYTISGDTGTYFVKPNQASQVQMFEAEALGLKQMLETKTIRVPKPIGFGTATDFAYIVLEWLELGGGSNTQSWKKWDVSWRRCIRQPLPNPLLGQKGLRGGLAGTRTIRLVRRHKLTHGHLTG